MTPEARAILNRAADLVEQGWCQKFMVRTRPDDSKCYCLSGGIAFALDEVDEGYSRLGDQCRMAVRRAVLSQYGMGIIEYNDTPGRTQAEVVAVLRAVAKEGGES